MPATPALKLTYLNIDGRAAVIRKTFTLGGIPFEDERVPRDLTPLMHKLPYGKVPVLEIDGEVVAETQVLQRYAGELTGMYPPSDEPLAAAMVDEIIDSFDDFFQRIMMPSFVECDATKKKEMREALLQGPLTNALELLDTRLAQIQKYPFFKDNATKVYIHEIMAWNYVGFMRSGIVDHVPTTFIDKYKTMVAMHAKIEGLTDVNQRFPIYESSPKLTPPKKLKLTYFDMPGRAEHIRIALQIGGLPFEDERISFEEVTKRKHEFPNGQVPVLLVDDQYILAQSVAILRYVGKFTGLYPVNDTLSARKIDEVLSHIEELYYALDPSFMEKDPAKKKAMRETLATSTIPKSLDSLNKRLDQFKLNVKSPFAMGGENPTIADLGIYSLVMFLQSGFLDHVPTTIVDAYPHILQSNEAVRQYPRVQEWYASKSLPAV